MRTARRLFYPSRAAQAEGYSCDFPSTVAARHILLTSVPMHRLAAAAAGGKEVSGKDRGSFRTGWAYAKNLLVFRDVDDTPQVT